MIINGRCSHPHVLLHLVALTISVRHNKADPIPRLPPDCRPAAAVLSLPTHAHKKKTGTIRGGTQLPMPGAA